MANNQGGFHGSVSRLM
jgi:hypothetical protein